MPKVGSGRHRRVDNPIRIRDRGGGRAPGRSAFLRNGPKQPFADHILAEAGPAARLKASRYRDEGRAPPIGGGHVEQLTIDVAAA